MALVLVVTPFPKLQKRFVILPREPSLKVTVSGGLPDVGAALNNAKGAGGVTAVIVVEELLAELGSAVLAYAPAVLKA